MECDIMYNDCSEFVVCLAFFRAHVQRVYLPTNHRTHRSTNLMSLLYGVESLPLVLCCVLLRFYGTLWFRWGVMDHIILAPKRNNKHRNNYEHNFDRDDLVRFSLRWCRWWQVWILWRGVDQRKRVSFLDPLEWSCYQWIITILLASHITVMAVTNVKSSETRMF